MSYLVIFLGGFSITLWKMLNSKSFVPELVWWHGCVTLKNVGCNFKSQSSRLEGLLPDAVRSMQRSILHFIPYLDWSQQASWAHGLCHGIVFHWSLSAWQTNHFKMWGFGNLSPLNDFHRNLLGSLAGFFATLPRVSSLARVKCNHHFVEALSERLIAVLQAIPLKKWTLDKAHKFRGFSFCFSNEKYSSLTFMVEVTKMTGIIKSINKESNMWQIFDIYFWFDLHIVLKYQLGLCQPIKTEIVADFEPICQRHQNSFFFFFNQKKATSMKRWVRRIFYNHIKVNYYSKSLTFHFILYRFFWFLLYFPQSLPMQSYWKRAALLY